MYFSEENPKHAFGENKLNTNKKGKQKKLEPFASSYHKLNDEKNLDNLRY
jgi:hypothetical protein